MPYYVGNLPTDFRGVNVRQLAIEALNEWNGALGRRGLNTGFSIVETADEAQTGIVFHNNEVYNGARIPPNERPASSQSLPGTGGETLKSTITIWLANKRFFDAGQPNFARAIKSDFLHEIGHTLGLRDLPFAPTLEQPCGQTPSVSLVNVHCRVNGNGSNPNAPPHSPVTIAPCDEAAIQAYSPPLPPPPAGDDTPGDGSGDGPPGPGSSDGPVFPDDFDGDGDPDITDCAPGNADIFHGRNDQWLCDDFHAYGDLGLDMDCNPSTNEQALCTDSSVIIRMPFVSVTGDPGPPPLSQSLISLQVSNGQYVAAEDGGGGAVNADRDSVGPWERFSIFDWNGGGLVDGDEVSLGTSGGSYLQAEGCGGGALPADSTDYWSAGRFRISIQTAGNNTLENGELFALKSDCDFFVKAEDGGGSSVSVTGVAVGAWERFRLIVHAAAPSIAIGDVTVSESATSQVGAAFTVTLSNTTTQPVTVHWTTADGSAAANLDYSSASGVLSIPAGDLSGTITVSVLPDALTEMTKQFFVNLSSATNANLSDSQGIGTIIDAAVPQSVTVNLVGPPQNVQEDSQSSTDVQVRIITADGLALAQTVTANYTTVAGSAAAASDYVASSGMVQFAQETASEETRTISIGLLNDSVWDSGESFSVRLTSAVGAALGLDSLSITILDGDPDPRMALDAPANGSVATQPMVVGGWAIDRTATSGTGVDAVHVWAFPADGAPAVFLGAAPYGSSRTDVGAAFGSQFTTSGFHLTAPSLAPGAYTVVAYAHSTRTGTFNQSQGAVITTNVLVSVDAPSQGSTVGQPFTIAGWALDQTQSSSVGVDTLHIWAYPVAGGSPIWVGAVWTGVQRADVAATYGAQFMNSGWGGSAAGVPAGTYDLVVYPLRTATNQFEPPVVRRVTVQ